MKKLVYRVTKLSLKDGMVLSVCLSMTGHAEYVNEYRQP